MTHFWFFFLEFQTFISGIIGFIGVMLTLLVNSKLQRNQNIRLNEDRVAYEVKIRNDEVNSLISALISELEVNKNAIRGLVSGLARNVPVGNFHMIPRRILNDIFNNNLQHIGILPQKKSKALVSIYSNLERIDDDLICITKFANSNYDQDFIFIPSGNAAMKASNYISPYIDEIEKAISIIKVN